jgi:multiple sugar transport system permease protein
VTTTESRPAPGGHGLAARRRAALPLRRRLRPAFLHLWAIVAATAFVYPLVWMASASVKPNWAIYRAPLALIPDAPTLEAYVELFRTTPFLAYTLNSVLYAAAGGVVSIGFGLITAYGFSRHRFTGRKGLFCFFPTKACQARAMSSRCSCTVRRPPHVLISMRPAT